MAKPGRDLHSRIAYGKGRTRARVVAGIYNQWTSANYGKTQKTQKVKVTDDFKPFVEPFDLPSPPFRPYVIKE